MPDPLSPESAGELPGDDLAHAARRHREARALALRLEQRRAELAAAETAVAAARERSAEADSAAEAMRSMSWARLRAAVAGDREERLDATLRDSQEARYALGLADQHLLDARAEHDALEARLGEYAGADSAYAAALARREDELQAAGGSDATALLDLERRHGDLGAERRETDEAFEAGRAAEWHLAEAGRHLSSARSWAGWDTFGGGGLFSDLAKHDRLRDARASLERADRALGSFDRELADLNAQGIGSVDSVLDHGFVDIFFDGFFADMMMRDRIIRADEQVAAALDQVRRLLHHLHGELGRLDADLATTYAARERLVLAGSGIDPDADQP